MKRLILIFAFQVSTFSAFAQFTQTTNLLYTTNSNVSVGASTIQGTYGGTDKAIEVVSTTGSYLNLKTGADSMFLAHNAAYPSGFYLPSTKTFGFFVNSLTIPSLQLQTNGNVSIGRVGGPAIYKLAVGGKIIAEELKVQMQSSWPDYVFKDDYQLPTLAEVEKQIEKNGHLLNIPSAETIKKEGFEVGEMNRLLLEKVEELTLYIISLNKKIESQEQKIRCIETQIDK